MMKTNDPTVRVSKDGNRAVMTEFEVRLLDQYGDCHDVHHHPSEAEARADATRLLPDAKAIVIEKHVSCRPAHLYGEPDVYTVIATFGDEAALREGGWLK